MLFNLGIIIRPPNPTDFFFEHLCDNLIYYSSTHLSVSQGFAIMCVVRNPIIIVVSFFFFSCSQFYTLLVYSSYGNTRSLKNIYKKIDSVMNPVRCVGRY